VSFYLQHFLKQYLIFFVKVEDFIMLQFEPTSVILNQKE